MEKTIEILKKNYFDVIHDSDFSYPKTMKEATGKIFFPSNKSVVNHGFRARAQALFDDGLRGKLIYEYENRIDMMNRGVSLEEYILIKLKKNVLYIVVNSEYNVREAVII